MRDVATWLQELGLGRFARTFAEHEIDFDALPHLTEKMLAELGLPIGPRAKLLAAIAGMSSPQAPRPDRVREAGTDGESTAPRREAERRQMTVMFCDLVDSTKLARGLDPEDFKAVMEAYQKACAAVIERYDGHVAQYRGDGIEAYFGWPAAHEDAPERAVRAGLDAVTAVKALETPLPLSVRVGISTGIVVIGETGDGDPSTPSGAVGDTPYVAARLQALAAPNSVVIAETTRRLLVAQFDEEALGPQELKGIAEPIPAFRVRHAREGSSRFRKSRAIALTPLVGRQTELALLQQRWRDAREGEGQVVYISGVPGIGKSRLVHELEQRIGVGRRFALRLQCSPHHMQSAFFPVIQQIRRLAGIANRDSAQVKLFKITRLLSLATDDVDKAAPFIAEMVSIPLEPRYTPAELSALQVKVQTLFVLVDLLLSLAARGPVLCLLEDTQWIDPSTQELLELAAGRIAEARVLLVVTHRPDFVPRSGAQGNVSALTLSRLGRRDVEEMAQLVLREQSVWNSVMRRVIEESDSIPLFVEELARGIIESDTATERRSHDRAAEPLASWSVPDSLRDSLVARLDRAPEARSVAQMAAVLGREFSYEMLRGVASMSGPELDSALGHLQRGEIIQQIDSRTSGRYAFKHALLRDAAYESLLKSSRREIHTRVARVIETQYPDLVAAQPELLAYHYSLAGDPGAAVRYWVLGGQRARSRSANLEAAGQFYKAVEFLAQLPASRERDGTELEIQLSLGLCSIATRGYSSDETRKAFDRACALSATLSDTSKEVQALFGLWGHFWMKAQHDRAIELAQMLLTKAETLDDPTAQIVGYRSIGSTLFTLGDFVGAREHLERSIALAREAAGEGMSLAYAVDPRIAAQLLLAWDLWILGHPAQALDNSLQALERATERGDPYSLAFAHYVTSAVHLLRGEPQASLSHADQSFALSVEHRINLYALYARFGRGCALAQMDRESEALVEIRQGINQARESNLGYMQGFMLGWLATAHAATGDLYTALSTIEGACRLVNDIAGRAWEAELLRLRGQMLLAARPGAAPDAERSYREAIAVAQRQHARSLELRATTSLARLLRRQGRDGEARTVLAPIYAWFTEGLDTADLRAAKTLADELG